MLYGYKKNIYINLIKINHNASLIYMNVSTLYMKEC